MEGVVRGLHAKPRLAGERGIPKAPVPGLTIRRAGVDGDHNVYREERKAGDPDMAVLLLPEETLADLRAEGWAVRPGHLGENVTTSGIPYDAFAPGTRWRVGGALLEVSKACDPCTNLRVLPYVSERAPAFVRALLGRRGWYARVVEDGDVRVGDVVRTEG